MIIQMEQKMYELTNPQKSIWLTEQYFQNTTINNICGSLIIKQDTDLNILNKAINIFVKNNDSFKLRFKQNGSELEQYFSKDEDFNFEILNIIEEKQIEVFAKKIVDTKFSIIDSRVFDFKLFKLSSGFGGFIVNVHHIISDAATFSLIGTEIVEIYSKLINNEDIPTKTYSYIDYINSEKEYLKSPRFEKDKEYWKEQLSPLPEVATVFSTNSDKVLSNYIADRAEFVLDNNLINKIKDFCTRNKISVYNFLIGIYSIYFGKTNNMDIFTFGTPVLNRTNFAEKHTSGMFISTSLLKIDMSQNKSFKQFSQDIYKTCMQMLRHQKYNYQLILDDVRKNDSSISELYDIGLSYQITQATDSSLDIPYSTKWYGTDYVANTLDVHFHDNDDSGNLLVEYDYQVCKLAREDILSIHNRILEIINQVLKNENIPIFDIDIVTKEERNIILNQFNNYKKDFPIDKNIVDLFNEQVLKNPNNIAVIFKDEKLTYEELDKKSNQFAWYLISKHNIKPNSIISVCMNRNTDFIITVLGILKTGSSYLPIHPDYPLERIDYIIKNSNSKLFITNTNINIENKINFVDINLEDFSNKKINIKIDSNSLAYVIYTSGSTGKPKGVLLKHSNLINFLYSFNSKFNNKFSEKDNCLSITNISFDVSVCELFVPLVFGSSLVLYEENTLTSINLLINTIIKNNVTFMYIPPNILQTLYEYLVSKKEDLKINKLLVGVESIKNSTLNNYYNLNNNIEIVNGYGPTETTICCTFFKFSKTKNLNDNTVVPIGKPLTNNNIFILNKNLHIQPINVPGELYVCGNNVSLGYLGNEELTNKSFIKMNDETFYKTGDLGYFDPDGNIHFLGRNDHQIKIRGHRVELGEITNTLNKIDLIKTAFTVISNVNNKSVICSYVVLKNKELAKTSNYIYELKRKLNEYLPYYMIPTYFIALNEMPINLSGKVDKSKLPVVDVNKFYTTNMIPSNETEKFLQTELLEILNLKELSTQDNYFDFGADSLSCIKLIAEISNKFKIDIKISDLFQNNTIKLLAEFIDKQKNKKKISCLSKAENKDYYDLSSAQKRIYYGSYILDSSSISYNLPGGIFMDKIPDIEKLENCFNKLIERNESLRTYFEIIDGVPVQKICKDFSFKIDVINATDDNINNYFVNFVKPFDLSKAPILRVRIIKLIDNTALLLFDTHHIISDGTSMQILISDLCKLYNDEELEEIKFTYKDYSEWENSNLKSGTFEDDKKFWLSKFNDDIPVLNLPYIHPRPAKKSFKGAKIYKTLNSEFTKKINDLCKELQVTPYMFLLGAYYILLSKYSTQTIMVVGSPVIARENSDTQNIIGMFVNTLPLKFHVHFRKTFNDYMDSVKDMCLKAFEHQSYPFNEIVNNLNITRDASRNPLFDVLFTYQNEGNPTVNLNGINSTYYLPDSKIAKFDLSLEAIPENDKLNLSFEYCTNLFTHSFINTMANHYLKILEDVVNNPEIKLFNIDMLYQKEKNKILVDFNKSEMDYPEEKSLVDLFKLKVYNNPLNIAIEQNGKKLTYKDLDEKSNTICLNILNNKNIPKNSIIGVFMNKSIELVILIWGILKAGHSYMPMYVGYPKERLDYMLDNSRSPLVFTNQEATDFKAETIFINNFENIKNTKNINNVKINPDDIAYVIYTSGSTGKPKGVKITHKCLNNYVHSFYNLFGGISSNDRLLSSTNISFDVSIWELFLSLLNGATLVIYEEEIISNIVKYADSIVNNKITTLYIPPNILEEVYDLLKTKPNVKINKLLVGVEPIKRHTLNKYFNLNPNIKIVNGYGPTETTICSTALEYTKSIKLDKIVSIGKPIGNTKIYILDKYMHIVPIGVSGEICITGNGVGKGYIANEEETNKNFVKNTFNDLSPKIYKTGDLAKWNYDGTISYISRIDNQVKISGYRVELSGIDNTVIKYPSVFKSCSQVYKAKSKSYLVTYFTADKKIDTQKLTLFLQSKLAFYMVPNILIQLDSFPLTVNGKIDIKKLPKPIVNSQSEYVAPTTKLEKNLCEIWQNLFDIKKVGINDNFFNLGGDSLSAIKLQVEALNKNLNITYADIFAYPTIRLLAKKATSASSLEENKFENYDYSKINKLLEYNDVKNISNNIELKPIKNVLLTGATGFLGSHILDSYFSTNNIGTIYCFVRNKNNKEPIARLKEQLNFYFGNKYDDYFGTKIKVIKADTSLNNFGLSENEYNDLANNIDIVINSAAIVKHYGDYNKFYNINVVGTKNLINFCEKFNKKLYHISTTSVSGLGLPENSFKQEKNIIYFGEKDLYKNQNLNNTYLQTKFEAEKIILEEVSNNKLNATIFRMGNISNRYIDGKFQINANENAFVNRIKAIVKLGVIQNGFKKHSTEFAPVDFCANAIINLIQSNPDFTIFHIFNNKLISFVNLIKFINELDIKVDFVTNKDFSKKVSLYLKDPILKNDISGIVTDLDSAKKFKIVSNILMDCDFSVQYLNKIGFNWPEINKEYITKYIEYFKNINLL